MYNSGKSKSHKTRHWVGALLIHLSYEVAASLSLNMAMGLRVGDLLSAFLRLPSDVQDRMSLGARRMHSFLKRKLERKQYNFSTETFKVLPTPHMHLQCI